jgi:4-azaleucine resistance transporter AzlC
MIEVENRFRKGIVDGVPIALGYISVSFTFGMMAVSYGMDVWFAVLISLMNLTSAGQFSGLTLMIEQASLMELALSQLIINLRYALMSLSLTQKVEAKTSTLHRMIMSFAITDEIFAMAASQPDKVGKKYFYGLMTLPIIGWTMGTLLGGVAYSLLPQSIQTALGIAIYGMFIAIIIPPARKEKNILFVVILGALVSCLLSWLQVSSGFAVIICAFVAAGLGAFLFPVKED